MTPDQLRKIYGSAAKLAEVVGDTGDQDLTEILDQLLIYICKLEA
jgi:hypothetical protein